MSQSKNNKRPAWQTRSYAVLPWPVDFRNSRIIKLKIVCFYVRISHIARWLSCTAESLSAVELPVVSPRNNNNEDLVGGFLNRSLRLLPPFSALLRPPVTVSPRSLPPPSTVATVTLGGSLSAKTVRAVVDWTLSHIRGFFLRDPTHLL